MPVYFLCRCRITAGGGGHDRRWIRHDGRLDQATDAAAPRHQSAPLFLLPIVGKKLMPDERTNTSLVFSSRMNSNGNWPWDFLMAIVTLLAGSSAL
ncbi:MAG: hypothetical protein VKI42_07695 [Synechococcaceae cyanobacterium]|nr:hypothetical protein [Synechococcaceae cyanobacterium]